MKSQQILSQTYAVITAAGTGSRMQANQNKQFLQIGRFPVIIRTLRVFDAHPQINGYLVTAAPGEITAMQNLIRQHGLKKSLGVVVGGETRQSSVFNGLKALSGHIYENSASRVLVHDGARCFVTSEIIDRVIAGIEKYGACGAAMPVKDTIKRASADGAVAETLERSQLWAMQTPQGADYTVLLAAYQRAAIEQWQVTDDLSVLELAGIPVWLTTGDYRNIKLTTPEDLLMAEQLAKLDEQNIVDER
jgi:2-C-methyl-D-erythritol 4-phosphate cytidylyltransferase